MKNPKTHIAIFILLMMSFWTVLFFGGETVKFIMYLLGCGCVGWNLPVITKYLSDKFTHA